MISDQTLQINTHHHFRYGSPLGFFFTYNPKTKQINNIRSCREEFAWNFRKTQKFAGFYCDNINIKKVNKFFEKREEKLGLEIKSIFYKTNVNNIIIVEFAPFWLNNPTNKGVFTLLLRAAAVYYNYSFDDSLLTYPLASKVIPAIKHFMNGNIVPTYNNLRGKPWESGFVAKFTGKTQEELNKMLIRPPAV